jgi:acyl carrier protein
MELKKLLIESFGMKENQFIDEQTLIGLEQFDSMNHMYFITNLEEKYNIELTGDEIVSLQTIKDVKDILLNKGINQF